MAKPLIEIAFRMTGRGFAPEAVTRIVELAPTKTWRLGDDIQQTKLRRKHDGWVFGLPQQETYQMDELLCKLLDAIEPHKEKIVEAAKQYRLEKEISFGVYLRGEAPASHFAAETVRRTSAFGAGLDIDLIFAT